MSTCRKLSYRALFEHAIHQYLTCISLHLFSRSSFFQYDNRDHRHEHGHHGHKGSGPSRHQNRFGSLKRQDSDLGGRTSGSRENSSSPPESSIYAAHFTETERRITQSPNDGSNQFKSPQEILATSGSVEAVRERNVTNSLLDFFGM